MTGMAFVGTYSLVTSEVTFCTLQVVDGILIEEPENPPVSDFDHGYSESIVVLDEDDSPELRAELTGILKRRFEFLQ